MGGSGGKARRCHSHDAVGQPRSDVHPLTLGATKHTILCLPQRRCARSAPQCTQNFFSGCRGSTKIVAMIFISTINVARSGEEDTHTDLGFVHFKEIRSSGSPQMQTGYTATWHMG